MLETGKKSRLLRPDSIFTCSAAYFPRNILVCIIHISSSPPKNNCPYPGQLLCEIHSPPKSILQSEQNECPPFFFELDECKFLYFTHSHASIHTHTHTDTRSKQTRKPPLCVVAFIGSYDRKFVFLSNGHRHTTHIFWR